MLFQLALRLEYCHVVAALGFFAHEVRDLEVLLVAAVVLVVPELAGGRAQRAGDVGLVEVVLELVLVVEQLAAELRGSMPAPLYLAVRVIRDQVAVLVELAVLLVPLQVVLRVKLLLLQHACLVFHAHLANPSNTQILTKCIGGASLSDASSVGSGCYTPGYPCSSTRNTSAHSDSPLLTSPLKYHSTTNLMSRDDNEKRNWYVVSKCFHLI